MNRRVNWQALVEDVLRNAGRGTPEEMNRAFAHVARSALVTVEDLEVAYDREYRHHLADRGIDP